MIALQLDELELPEAWLEPLPQYRARVDFPIHLGTGARSTSVVYFELAPGAHCGRHTDSAEEILLIMDGEAEIDVGDETGRLHAGGLALAPAMEPHDVRNVGETTLKVLGFFSSATLVSEHDDVIHPFGTDLLVIGAPEREPAAA